jgi:hypothetical protein
MTNLPVDDLFAEGSPVYGDVLQRFIGIQPWSTNPEVVTGLSLQTGWGHIFDGRSDAAGSGRAAAITHQASVPDDDRITFVVQRDTEAWDFGDVSYSPELVLLDNPFDTDTVRGCGVCARVTAGTLTTPGGGDHSDRYYTDVTGYFYIHGKQTAANHELFLLELNAGAITLLQQVDVNTLPGGMREGMQDDEAELPLPMRIRITDAGGGQVNIQCYRKRFVGMPGGLGGVTEDQVFPTLLRNPISASGRCGFGLQLAKTQAGPINSTMICQEFRVDNIASLHSIDNFDRLQPTAGRQLTDPLSRTGSSLEVSFTGDSQGDAASSFQHFGHLLRDVADRLDAGSTPPTGSGQVHGWYMAQRLAGSVQQHRSISVTVINATTEEVRAGIMLRAIWFPSTFHDFRARVSVGGGFRDYRKQGYLCLVKFISGGSPAWELEIRAHQIGGSIDPAYRAPLIATVDLTAAGLGLGTAFILDFEVQNFDGNEFGNGTWPVMRAKINGTIQTPIPNPAIPGLSEADDFLIDSRSEAIVDGLGEGFYLDVSAVNASQLARFDTWTEETLTDPPDVGAENEASIVLDAETAGQTGTLLTPLSWPVDISYGGYEPFKHRFETGQAQLFPRSQHSRREWAVQCSGGATTAEREALLTFFDDHKGIEIPFAWVWPRTDFPDETVNVRCLNVSLDHVMQWAGGTKDEAYTLLLGEVFDHVIYNEQL